jgi:hypothetical protein
MGAPWCLRHNYGHGGTATSLNATRSRRLAGSPSDAAPPHVMKNRTRSIAAVYAYGVAQLVAANCDVRNFWYVT